MSQANDSVLVTPGPATGAATIATHLINGKEYQVVLVATDDGFLTGAKDSYVAIYKLATDVAISALAFTHVANTDKQYATIYHAATAVKTVRIRRIEVFVSATAASVVSFDLRRLTAGTLPATGNPAIVPVATSTAVAAAEVTCLALPTTAGSITAGVSLFTQELNLGANTALLTTHPINPIVLWPAAGDGEDQMEHLDIRAGVAEGYAVSVRAVAAVALKATIRILFTEHTPAP